MSNEFEKMFGDIFGGNVFGGAPSPGDAAKDMVQAVKLRAEITTLKKQLKEEREKNERLKRKARRLLDIAWNKALDKAVDAVYASRDEQSINQKTATALCEKLRLLRRTVREA